MQFFLTRCLIVVTTLAAFPITVANAAGREYSGKLTMMVRPSAPADASAASLEFRLKYYGTDPISASVENLPGERLFHFLSLRAERYTVYGTSPLIRCPQPRERIFIDDPGVGYKTIMPGQEISQTIDLFKLYDNLEEIIGKCDLVVFWSHKIDLEGDYQTPRLAGAAVFPATLDIKQPGDEVGEIRKNQSP